MRELDSGGFALFACSTSAALQLVCGEGGVHCTDSSLSGAYFRWLCWITTLHRQGVREAADTPAGNLDISLNVSATETVLFNNAWGY